MYCNHLLIVLMAYIAVQKALTYSQGDDVTTQFLNTHKHVIHCSGETPFMHRRNHHKA